jgi:hypothetical protein
VIGALEDAEDYKAFEAAIIADYDAQSAWSANWCCGWQVYCGGSVGPPQLKPACSKLRLSI